MMFLQRALLAALRSAIARLTIDAECGVDRSVPNRINRLQINLLIALFRVLLHIKIAASLVPCFHKNNKAVQGPALLFLLKAGPFSFHLCARSALRQKPFEAPSSLPVVFSSC
jgi:hypothetical protein